MITPAELEILLRDLESDRIERTVSQGKIDKFAEAVCAFANDLPGHGLPGYLVVGVQNDGQPSGLKVTDTLLSSLGGLRSDGNILPVPTIAVQKMALSQGEVAVVEVRPSDLPPVRYKGQIWIRVGPRRGIASEQDERLLTERRVARAHSFDVTPVQGAEVSDLSLALFAAYRQEVIAADVLAANHRGSEEQLASLRFLDPRTAQPSVAGILLFGKNPRYFFPGAYIQYLRLKGITLTEIPEDQAEISGDLLSVLRELDTRIHSTIQTSIRPVSTLKEKTLPDYPQVAVRELLLNAILHRDYQSHSPVRFYWFSDRIEIQSPGGLYGEVTRETLTRRNSYRNPVLAEAMKGLGYVNRFGYGIQRAMAALQENGNPPLDFDVDNQAFLVIIRRRSE